MIPDADHDVPLSLNKTLDSSQAVLAHSTS